MSSERVIVVGAGAGGLAAALTFATERLGGAAIRSLLLS